MGHDIHKIQHLPGAVNFVGDALSRKYTNVPRTDEDGSGWSVECDWFAGSGLVFDLYTVADAGDVNRLKACFAGRPWKPSRQSRRGPTRRPYGARSTVRCTTWWKEGSCGMSEGVCRVGCGHVWNA
jgi:hypothetical protein